MTMNFLVRGTETTRVEFDDGAWIDIRTNISIGERDAIAKRARKTKTRSTVDPKTRQASIESVIDFDEGVWMSATMETIIVAWSDELPVTPENIAKLPERMQARVQRAFDELNPAEETDERKNSGSALPATTGQAEADSPESWVSFSNSQE